MKIIKHKEYNLTNPKFLCDYDLNEHNTEYPFKHFTNNYKFVVLCGKSGSGKTSLLISMLTCKNIFKKTFNNLLVYMPKHSRASLKKNIFDENLDSSKLFDALDYKNLSIGYEMIKLYSENDESTLLILDDCGSFLKDYSNNQLLLDICNNRRHYHCTIICLVQVYNSIPLNIRKGINDIIIFYRPNINEINNIFQELLEEHDKDKIKEIFDYIFDEKYNYMVLDTDTQRVYKKNIELIYKDANR